MSEDRKTPQLDPSWLAVMGDEFEKPYMDQLRAFLREEMKRFRIFPPGRLFFNAMNLTPYDKVKVVLLGQDPYIRPNQAHGLCFSVNRGVELPASLVNIFKELQDSLGIPPSTHGDLTHWAEQGVLLLNTTLSVREGQSASHAGHGWETFTDRVIAELVRGREGLVFLLWGAHAGKKAAMIDSRRHLVLKCPHPSPLSASRGFFGCGHFVKTNQHLAARGLTPIDWRLPA